MSPDASTSTGSDVRAANAETAALLIFEKQAEIAYLQEQVDELKSLFKNNDYYSNPGSYQLGDVTLKVASNARIDDKLARKHLSEDMYQLVSQPTVVPALARRYLDADLLDVITIKHAPRLTFVSGEDN